MLTQIRNVAENSKSNSLGGIFVMFCFSFFWNKTIRIFCLLLAHDCCELLLFLSLSNCFIKYFIDSSNHFLVSLCWNTTHGSYTFSEILQISISERVSDCLFTSRYFFSSPKITKCVWSRTFFAPLCKIFQACNFIKKRLHSAHVFSCKIRKIYLFWRTSVNDCFYYFLFLLIIGEKLCKKTKRNKKRIPLCKFSW